MFSLKRLCFDSIIKDFKRFYLAFKMSDDEIMKRNLEFLQRKYSFEVSAKLFKDEMLEEEYSEFLLNEHLQKINGDWLKCDHDVTFSEDILCRLPNLKAVCFSARCSDEDLKNITKFCSKLDVISMDKSAVTDNGIKYLCKDINGKCPCPELKEIYIRDTLVTTEGVACIIQNLSSLEFLFHEDVPLALYSLHKDAFSEREKTFNYNLAYLKFSEEISSLPYYNDILKVCLTVCSKLKAVTCDILEEQQLDLFSNTYLEELYLYFMQTDRKIDVNNFLNNNGYNITTLKLYNCIISITDLAVNCPKLSNFRILDSTFQVNEKSQNIFRNLEACYFQEFEDDDLTNKAIRFCFSASPKLQIFYFVDCVLSPDTKSYILYFCENHLLKEIAFFGTIVEIDFIKNVLSSCTSLERLLLERICSFRDAKEIVELAETLPNKPQIHIDGFVTHIQDYENDDYDSGDVYESEIVNDYDDAFDDLMLSILSLGQGFMN